MEDKIGKLPRDNDSLLNICGPSFKDVPQYQLFVRHLLEQTIVEDGVRRMRKKEDGGLDSTALQSPSDPDATYRVKAGKTCRGYTANVTESVDGAGSVVTDYQNELGIYSDSQFLKDSLEETQAQEEKSVLVTDGGYSWGGNTELAAEKNIRLLTTALAGKDTPEVLADFKWKEDGTEVLECAAENTPKSYSYTKRTKQCKGFFCMEQCQNCLYKTQCNPKFKKTVATFHNIPECIKQGESPAVHSDGRIQMLRKNPERGRNSAVKPEKELPSGKTSTGEATEGYFSLGVK